MGAKLVMLCIVTKGSVQIRIFKLSGTFVMCCPVCISSKTSINHGDVLSGIPDKCAIPTCCIWSLTAAKVQDLDRISMQEYSHTLWAGELSMTARGSEGSRFRWLPCAKYDWTADFCSMRKHWVNKEPDICQSAYKRSRYRKRGLTRHRAPCQYPTPRRPPKTHPRNGRCHHHSVGLHQTGVYASHRDTCIVTEIQAYKWWQHCQWPKRDCPNRNKYRELYPKDGGICLELCKNPGISSIALYVCW